MPLDYTKDILSFDEQLDLLEERGLIISNRSKAKYYLQNISYYRLSGYWWGLQTDQVSHDFIDGVTFDDIINRYTFDRQLRLIVFDAIERIEIALRTSLIYHISHEEDSWYWFENEDIVKNLDHFDEDIVTIDRELKQTNQIFIKEHYNKYGRNKRPPCLKTLEVLSLGTLSKLYYNLQTTHPAKARISNAFGLSSVSDAESWFRTVSSIRNKVAHHSRLWNDKLPFQMAWLNRPKSNWIEKPDARGTQRIYYFLSCILYMLNVISKGHTVDSRLKNLIINKPSTITLESMGFPKNWTKQELWQD